MAPTQETGTHDSEPQEGLMRNVKVADLMTDEAVSVAPDTSFRDVAMPW
ncbi:hypothetical protein [Streptomyces sp. NPDC101132]